MIKSKKTAAVALACAIAIPAEGLRQYAYNDPVGILTVCYGTTGDEVKAGKRYSLEECKSLLSKDMVEAVEQVNKCHPDLPTEILAAFADATYNAGPKIACNSTASKYLTAGNLVAACRELPKWNKARVAGVLVELPGLTKRRNKEMELCLQGA